MEIARVCEKAGVVLALGYQRRRESHFRWIKAEIDAGRFGKLVQAEGNISRDRLGQFDLSSWRYQAAGMPGGVMLQIGIHYVDVLEMLMGPVKRVSGMLGPARAAGRQSRRRQPHSRARERRDFEPDGVLRLGVRVLHDEHLRQGGERLLRPVLRPAASQARREQGARRSRPRRTTPSARSSRSSRTASATAAKPETDGFWAARNLAVIKAGVKSAREGRAVEVAEMLASGE